MGHRMGTKADAPRLGYPGFLPSEAHSRKAYLSRQFSKVTHTLITQISRNSFQGINNLVNPVRSSRRDLEIIGPKKFCKYPLIQLLQSKSDFLPPKWKVSPNMACHQKYRCRKMQISKNVKRPIHEFTIPIIERNRDGFPRKRSSVEKRESFLKGQHLIILPDVDHLFIKLRCKKA